MIPLPSKDLPLAVRLHLLTEHVELERLRLLINAGTDPAIAVARITSPDQEEPR